MTNFSSHFHQGFVTIFSITALTADFLQFPKYFNEKLAKTLNKFLNIFYPLIFSSTFFVCSLFWMISSYNYELMIRPEYQKYLDTISSNCPHTFVIIPVIVESFLVDRELKFKKSTFAMNIFVGSIYLVVVLCHKLCSGRWIYPYLELFNLWQFPFFCLFSFSWLILFYFIGIALNNYIWRRDNGKKCF